MGAYVLNKVVDPDLLKTALAFTGILDFRYSLPTLVRNAFRENRILRKPCWQRSAPEPVNRWCPLPRHPRRRSRSRPAQDEVDGRSASVW